MPFRWLINKYFTSHIAETFGPPKLTLVLMLVSIATVCLVYLLRYISVKNYQKDKEDCYCRSS